MSPLYEVRDLPDLDAPVLVVALEGWIDAGLGASTALACITGQVEASTVAVFDADHFLDHRARRPIMHLENGVNTGLTWPTIEIQAISDLDGRDALLLVGAEPDHSWRAFADAVTTLTLDLGARLVTGLGAYPAPVPHTRSASVVSTATSADLARLVGFMPGRIEVPAGALAAIERQCADHGVPAVGLWAQVPHYASAMPYPGAAVALLDTLRRVTDLRFETTELEQEARATRARLDELVQGSAEHIELVQQLERQVDALDRGGELGQVSGDELAAELERFLREQGGA